MNLKRISLLLILVLAFVLRFYNLGSYPALNADEAAIGYNAWSLLQTGKDEHGNLFPIHFQSFNDYKPGGYFYIVMPFVALMGLNEWAVRIPGALLGVGTVFLIYLLSIQLTKLSGQKDLKYFPFIAALFLAISPWHIHFSRGGWEVNIATFFITLGVYSFFKAQQKSWWYFVSIISFVASLYTYHAARIIAPLLGLALIVIFRKNILKSPKKLVVACAIGLFVSIPLVIDFVGPAGASRATGVGLFADTGPLNRINEQRGEHSDFSNLVTKIYHNKPVNYGLEFLSNWASHFHGEFLFLSGDDIQRNKVPETGQMYLFDILFLILGVIYLIKHNKGFGIVVFWLLIAPIGAALTFQSPHALRAQNMIIPLVLISALGLTFLLNILANLIKNKNLLKGCYLLTGVAILLFFVRYIHMYYAHMAKEYTFSSQYGVKEMVEFVSQNQDGYQNIVITNRYDQPYILVLFYLKYPPAMFQNSHELTPKDGFGFSTVSSFGKFIFKEVDFTGDRVQFPNSLIIGTDEQIPKESNIIKQIYGTNDNLYFEAVAN